MKKYLNNKEERLDLHFKDKFENFETTPNQDVWENIEAGIDIEGFDEIFNNKLANEERTPAPEVWEKVQEGIPLNLFVKRHLENLMKIAAVLLCFMSATLYLTMDQNKSNPGIVVNTPAEATNAIVEVTPSPTETLLVEEEKEDFVSKIKKKKRKRKAKKAKKSQDADVDALWKLLMEDDEDFADVMDEETKLKILTPPVRLPLIEETVAMAENLDADSIDTPVVIVPDLIGVDLEDEIIVLEAKSIEPELKIWVPLVVVEQHEIEGLINMYDEAEASKRNNNPVTNQ